MMLVVAASAFSATARATEPSSNYWESYGPYSNASDCLFDGNNGVDQGRADIAKPPMAARRIVETVDAWPAQHCSAAARRVHPTRPRGARRADTLTGKRQQLSRDHVAARRQTHPA
jgi:hypothetical protein